MRSVLQHGDPRALSDEKLEGIGTLGGYHEYRRFAEQTSFDDDTRKVMDRAFEECLDDIEEQLQRSYRH